jgi:hypothetical protein
VDFIHLIIIYIIYSTTNVYLSAFIEQGYISLKLCLLMAEKDSYKDILLHYYPM